jgi:hypothetical protein
MRGLVLSGCLSTASVRRLFKAALLRVHGTAFQLSIEPDQGIVGALRVEDLVGIAVAVPVVVGVAAGVVDDEAQAGGDDEQLTGFPIP